MNGIRYGMPTLIEYNTLEECARLCQKLGLSFIEINMNFPQYQIDRLNPAELRRIMEEYNLFFTLHLDENLNVCDFNERIAAAHRENILDCIRLARELEIPVLNMQMSNGVYYALPDRKIFLFEQYKASFLHQLLLFRDVCEEAIGDSDVTLCVENAQGFSPIIQSGIDLLLEDGGFGLTLDTGSHHIGHAGDQQFFNRHVNQLRHIHLHDAAEGKMFLPLGEGEIPVQKLLSLAKDYHLNCVLENKTAETLEKSVQFLRRSKSPAAL